MRQEREENAGQAQAEGEEQGQPEGRVLTQMGSELETDRKAECRDEKPKKPSTEKEERESEHALIIDNGKFMPGHSGREVSIGCPRREGFQRVVRVQTFKPSKTTRR